MADTSVTVTAGAGTAIDTRTEATNGNHRQVVVLGDPSTNAGVAPVDAAAGLKVDLGSDNDVINAGTFAVQESGAALTALQLIDDTVYSDGAGTVVKGVAILGQDGTNPQAIKTDAAGELQVDVLTLPNAVVAGDVAHDAADSGNPIKTGGKAVSAEPTAVTANDRVNFISDLTGKQIVLPYANPENFVSGAITTAMTGTTSTSLVAAPGAGLRNYITQVTVSNAHATVGTDLILQDGSGGTTLYTIPAAAVYGGAVVTFPTPLRQPTANTALFIANVTTGASTKASASGYKGA